MRGPTAYRHEVHILTLLSQQGRGSQERRVILDWIQSCYQPYEAVILGNTPFIAHGLAGMPVGVKMPRVEAVGNDDHPLAVIALGRVVALAGMRVDHDQVGESRELGSQPVGPGGAPVIERKIDVGCPYTPDHARPGCLAKG